MSAVPRTGPDGDVGNDLRRLHTREVAGSIPAAPTPKGPADGAFPVSRVCPPPRPGHRSGKNLESSVLEGRRCVQDVAVSPVLKKGGFGSTETAGRLRATVRASGKIRRSADWQGRRRSATCRCRHRSRGCSRGTGSPCPGRRTPIQSSPPRSERRSAFGTSSGGASNRRWKRRACRSSVGTTSGTSLCRSDLAGRERRARLAPTRPREPGHHALDLAHAFAGAELASGLGNKNGGGFRIDPLTGVQGSTLPWLLSAPPPRVTLGSRLWLMHGPSQAGFWFGLKNDSLAYRRCEAHERKKSLCGFPR